MPHSPSPCSPSESQSPKDNHELINASLCDGNYYGTTSQQTPILDVHKGRPVRLQVKVMVPVQDHPNVRLVLRSDSSLLLKYSLELIPASNRCHYLPKKV